MTRSTCNEADCTRKVEDTSRCGGVLFGVKDGSVGCGRIFCTSHLVGRAGPFFCGPCWKARKEAIKAQAGSPQACACGVHGVSCDPCPACGSCDRCEKGCWCANPGAVGYVAGNSWPLTCTNRQLVQGKCDACGFVGDVDRHSAEIALCAARDREDCLDNRGHGTPAERAAVVCSRLAYEAVLDNEKSAAQRLGEAVRLIREGGRRW